MGQRRRFVVFSTLIDTISNARRTNHRFLNSGFIVVLSSVFSPLSAGQAQNYHQKEFTAKEQNYWSQRGEVAGEWQGSLAETFGLAGAVSEGMPAARFSAIC